MFSQDRNVLRRTYRDAWRKAHAGQPLEPLERLIAEVVTQHPEYQSLLESGDEALDRDWLPEHGETNPFLHLSLHLAILEQVQTDRPAGIRALYRQLMQAESGDVHAAEHRIMDCLAEAIWQAQRDGREPDMQRYLGCIERCIPDR